MAEEYEQSGASEFIKGKLHVDSWHLCVYPSTQISLMYLYKRTVDDP